MNIPERKVDEMEKQAYYKAWAEKRILSCYTWRCYPMISLETILKESKMDYIETLQYSKTLFWEYTYSLLSHKIAEFIKFPKNMQLGAARAEVAALKGQIEKPVTANDCSFLYLSIQRLIKEPFSIRYNNECFDINHPSCIAEAIATRNYYYSLEKFVEGNTGNQRLLFEDAIIIKEVDILFDFLLNKDDSRNQNCDGFWNELQELTFSAFNATEVITNYHSPCNDNQKKLILLKYSKKANSVKRDLEDMNGFDDSVLQHFIKIFKINVQEDFFGDRYNTCYIKFCKNHEWYSIDEELKILAKGDGKKRDEFAAQFNNALALLYFSKLERLLDLECIRYKERRVKEVAINPFKCKMEPKKLNTFIINLSNEKGSSLTFAENMGELEKFLVFGQLEEGKKITITGRVGLFCYFLYLIYAPSSEAKQIAKNKAKPNTNVKKEIMELLDTLSPFIIKGSGRELKSPNWESHFSKVINDRAQLSKEHKSRMNQIFISIIEPPKQQ